MIEWSGETLVIHGDLDGPAATALAAQLRQLAGSGPTLRIDLGELELDDGVAVAEMVNGLRALQRRWPALVLVEAPQMLAHTLYKVGMLDGERYQLIRPRDDEGTTAN
ncbi:MAG: STAS domain-containing protein [Myxococcota bacterium]